MVIRPRRSMSRPTPRTIPALPPSGDDRPWIEIPFDVEATHDGYRLDRFLKARVKRMSRTRLQHIIGRGQVRHRASGEPLKASFRVRTGDQLIVYRPAPIEPDAVMDYRVVYEDSALMVVDKPAGLAVHPCGRYHLNTLTALMRERLGDEHGWEMAHRLDRETSGLMLFGRQRERAGRRAIASGGVLKRLFQRREVHKQYLALAWGELRNIQVVDIPIGPAQGSAIRVKMGPRSLHDGGLDACTHVEPVAWGRFQGEPVTAIRCRPKTGRQHQIRVHLTALGHPLVGDKMYGIDEDRFLAVLERGRPMEELELELGLARHALHAAVLELPHPATEAPLRFEAPWPDELAAIIDLEARCAR